MAFLFLSRLPSAVVFNLDADGHVDGLLLLPRPLIFHFLGLGHLQRKLLSWSRSCCFGTFMYLVEGFLLARPESRPEQLVEAHSQLSPPLRSSVLEDMHIKYLNGDSCFNLASIQALLLQHPRKCLDFDYCFDFGFFRVHHFAVVAPRWRTERPSGSDRGRVS